MRVKNPDLVTADTETRAPSFLKSKACSCKHDRFFHPPYIMSSLLTKKQDGKHLKNHKKLLSNVSGSHGALNKNPARLLHR